MRYIIIFIALFFPSICSSAVIFEDNFDSHSDWSPTQPYSSSSFGSTDGATDGTTPCTLCPDGPVWSAFFLGRAAWADTALNNTMNIASTNARGGTGKALTLWNEPIDTSVEGSLFISDWQLAKDLGGTYNDLYIRYYIKFQADWAYPKTVYNSVASGQPAGWNGKFMRAAHHLHLPGVSYFKAFSDGTQFPVAVTDFNPTQPASGLPQALRLVNHYRYQSEYYGGDCPDDPTPTYLNYGSADAEYVYIDSGTAYNGKKTFEEVLGDGNWHSFQMHLKGNSGMGVADGEYEIYIDDTLVYSQKGVAWANDCVDPACVNCIDPAQDFVGWNWISIGGNQQNPVYAAGTKIEQWYAIDDVVVSTTYIGDDYVIGGSPAASANKRTRIGAKDLRIGGKSVEITQ